MQQIFYVQVGNNHHIARVNENNDIDKSQWTRVCVDQLHALDFPAHYYNYMFLNGNVIYPDDKFINLNLPNLYGLINKLINSNSLKGLEFKQTHHMKIGQLKNTKFSDIR